MNNNLITTINEKVKPILELLPNEEKLNYYIKRETFIQPNEMLIIKYIDKYINHNLSICEVGCGYGQYLFPLCACGFACEAIEVHRFDGLIKIRESLCKEDPCFLSMTIHKGFYPTIMPLKKDVLLFNNMVSTESNKIEDKIIDSFNQFKTVLLNAGLFTTYRETATEQADLLVKINKATNCTTTQLSYFYYQLDIPV